MQRISKGREFHCFGAHLEKERWPKGLVLVWGHCVCRRTKLSGRGVHSEMVREIGMGGVREKIVTGS